MTAAELELLQRIQRRVAQLAPDMVRAYTRALRVLRESLSVSDIARLIESGAFDAILSEESLNDATLAIRAEINNTMQRAFTLSATDIPGAIATGARVNLYFDRLNPRVIDAIRRIETPAITTLREQARAVVRETVEAGLVKGLHPTAIARGLREVVGLARNQAAYVRNLRAELEAGDLSFAQRKLLASRTAGSLRKLVESGKAIPQARIDAVVAAYEKKWIAVNTDLNARLLSLDSYRAARRESYASAIDRGIIDRGRAVKRYVHYEFQDHPRPEHAAMNGETVPFDQPYSDGQMVAGAGFYNCRCADYFFMLPARK